MASYLFEEWLLDQQIAFCANIVASAADSCNRPIRAIAGDFIQRHLEAPGNERRLRLLSPSTLALLDYIPDEARKPSEDEGYDLTAVVARSCEVRRLLTANTNNLELVNYASQLLMGDIALSQFLRWAGISLGKQWTRLANAPDVVGALAEELQLVRDKLLGVKARCGAIDTFDQHLRRIYDLNNGEQAPFLWDRIARSLISRLFSWPLLVSMRGGEELGLSLPVVCELKPDPRFARKARFILEGDDWRLDPQNGEWGFHKSHLKLAFDWRSSFTNARQVAQRLWTSQNSRTSAERKAWVDASAIHVDMTIADRIVSAIYQRDGLRERLLELRPDLSDMLSEQFPIEGRSATAYLIQVAIAMLLPGDPGPHGTATGGVELLDGGLYALTDVEGIAAKLAYADASRMFSRVIVPDTPRTRQAIQSLDLIEQKAIEFDFCASARSAADALLSIGWRRAQFSRAPAVGRNFYRTIHRLFEYEQSRAGHKPRPGATDYLSSEDLADLRRGESGTAEPEYPLEQEQERKFDALLQYCNRTPNNIKYLDPDATGLGHLANERFIGEWLGWLDHKIRHEHEGRALSILCVRTTSEESDIRFWANVFELLGASDAQWRKFQWSNRTQSAEALAEILNNFEQAPAISGGISPDLFVVLDDAMLTQTPTNVIYPKDFRGQLYDLLQHHPVLRDRLVPFDETRERLLGRTRILVIKSVEREIDEGLAAEPVELRGEEDAWLTRLCIFRFGFTFHSALAVTDVRPERLRVFLESLIDRKLLFRHRGHYHVRRDIRRLRQDQHSHEDHWTAACAINPMLKPDALFVSSNRDRVLNHEEIGEAAWHLREAIARAKHEDTSARDRANAALRSLMLLRAETDWDTVQRLRGARDPKLAIELACELLEEEYVYRKGLPHPSRFAAAIQVIGRHLRYTLTADAGVASRKECLDKARKLFEQANAAMQFIYRTPESEEEADEKRRALTKLRSEYAFAIRAYAYHLPKRVASLDELQSAELRGLENTLETEIDWVLKYYAKLPAHGALDDGAQSVILSTDWLTEKWRDGDEQDSKKAARYAGAGALMRQTWPAAWIGFFALVRFDVNDVGLVASYLNRISNDALEQISNTYKLSSQPERRNRRDAILNLFDYLPRLRGPACDSALALIKALGFRSECVRLLANVDLSKVTRDGTASLFAQIRNERIVDGAGKDRDHQQAIINLRRNVRHLTGALRRHVLLTIDSLGADQR